MKPTLLLPLTAVLAIAASAATTAVLRCPAAEAGGPAGLGPDESARLASTIAALERRVDELAQSNERLRFDLEAQTSGAARTPDLESLVADILEKRGALASAAAHDGAVAGDASHAASGEEAFDAQAAFAALCDRSLSNGEQQALWQRYAKEGHLDELVALFEERARRNADDPQAQVDLGGAYLQKTFEAGGGPAAGKWAMMADKSFDSALALDDHHWEARFSKAISLSFWPPVLGKQGEAIQHFEILVAQQEQGPPKPGYADTYVFLGNTYQQIGNAEKALAAWQKGASLFPDNEDLQKQIATAGAH